MTMPRYGFSPAFGLCRPCLFGFSCDSSGQASVGGVRSLTFNDSLNSQFLAIISYI